MSKKMITAIVIVVALAAVAGFNYLLKMDPSQLAARGVGKDPHSHGHDHNHGDEGDAVKVPMEDLMRSIGPEIAQVQILALFGERATLENTFRPMFQQIVRDYQGHVRFEFVDNEAEEAERLIANVTNGRRVGLIINGEMVKEVPRADLGMLTFGGSPDFEDWSERELRMAIEWELEQAGVEFKSHLDQPSDDHHDHHHSHGHAHS
jgi:hypothetical protein